MNKIESLLRELAKWLGSTLTTNVAQVGGTAVPVQGTLPTVPTALYDSNGDIIESFGGDVPLIDPDRLHTANYDFTAAVEDSSKGVTVSGLNGTLADTAFYGAAYYIRSGVREPIPTTNVTVSGAVITFGDLSVDFATGDKVQFTLIGNYKTKDLDANVVMTTNEAEDRYHQNKLEWVAETLTVSGGATPTGYYVIPWDTYNRGSWTLDLASTALDCRVDAYVTNNSTITLPATSVTGWNIASDELLDGGIVITTGSSYSKPFIYNQGVPVDYVMIVITNGSAVNTLTATLRAKTVGK